MAKAINENQREIIKKRLEELDWSERQLAKKIGITPAGLNNFTNGRNNNLSPKYMIAIPKALQIDIAAFLEGKMEKYQEEDRITTDRFLAILEDNAKHLKNTDSHTHWLERLFETVVTMVKPVSR